MANNSMPQHRQMALFELRKAGSDLAFYARRKKMNTPRKPISRRDFLNLAGLSGAALILAGCGASEVLSTATAPVASEPKGPPSSDISATLTVFDGGGDADKTINTAAIKRFNERYPNVKVNDNFTPVTTWGDYANKLVTQVAGGQVPDLLYIAVEGTRLAVSKNLLLPLDDLIANDQTAKDLLADMSQSTKDMFTVDGKLYQFPTRVDTMLIYYNTKMFTDAGIEPPKPDWTWDDFLTIAKQLTIKSGSEKIYGFGVPFFNFGIMPWLLTNGASQLNDDWTKSTLDDPKALEAITFLRDLVLEHEVAPSPITGTEGLDIAQLFSNGKIGMIGGGHWYVPGFQVNNFTDVDVQIWPKKTVSTTVLGGGGVGIVKESKNVELAWELAKEMAGAEAVQAVVDSGINVPALLSAVKSEKFLSFPSNATAFLDSIRISKPVPSPANYNEVEAIFMRHMSEIISGSVSPEDGLKAAHEELSSAMEKL
jgi:multiple sugar transport system substrate-binding protein